MRDPHDSAPNDRLAAALIPNDRVAAALTRLCEREDLDASETAAVFAVALPDRVSLPRGSVPLLCSFAMAS